ncbi:MAG TPA: Crp/Fnr family transcriptional regulator [Pyrinomonadaceae bacterium]|nr:Crp/Fnr family transcriptional regulator [Pyrinomonadaceae bacterium]HMP64644.1 Crp/Fnr family transcriptional regulator [Pyrinomonadaceae bacterium]
MNLPTLKVEHKCTECGLREEGFFCCISDDSLDLFQVTKITNTYPVGSMLFVEGQPANGVYVLCQGSVKLYTCSQEGKVVILHIAKPGEILGLSAVVSGIDYEVSAEVIEPCQINYVRRQEMIDLIEKRADIAVRAIEHLSLQYHYAYDQIRSFGLTNSVAGKLAALMLAWCAENRTSDVEVRLKLPYTHEEIAEMIGSSRETVTRLLKDFRETELISLKGSDLLIHDTEKLRSIVSRPRSARTRRKAL